MSIAKQDHPLSLDALDQEAKCLRGGINFWARFSGNQPADSVASFG